jgi:predicted  nucleic acid-binding Zn-ribbon protein
MRGVSSRDEQRSQRRERQAARQRAYKASVELTEEQRRYFPPEIKQAMEALERLETSLASFDPDLANKVRGLRNGMDQLAAQITRAKAKAAERGR